MNDSSPRSRWSSHCRRQNDEAASRMGGGLAQIVNVCPELRQHIQGAVTGHSGSRAGTGGLRSRGFRRRRGGFRRVGGARTAMMVRAFVRGFGSRGRGGRLKVILQAGVGLLGGRKVAGLQGAREALVIGICLGVFAKGLGGRGLRTGSGGALQGFLKGRQGRLGRGNVAGLQGVADGLEALGNLGKIVLVRGLGRIGGRIDIGDTAHKLII